MPDPQYVIARAVLLDALDALGKQREAVIVVGAQAIYLHTRHIELAVPEFTTDADLTIDPTLLQDLPELEAAMKAAHFAKGNRVGAWVVQREVDGVAMNIEVDLMVPEAVGGPAPRRAVVSHDTALTLYDLAPSRSHEIHLTLPRERRPRTAQAATAVKLHTTTVPLRRDEVADRFGVQVTSPARTIADVADIGTDPSEIVEATARALKTGLISQNELHAAVKRRSTRVQQLVQRAIEEAEARA